MSVTGCREQVLNPQICKDAPRRCLRTESTIVQYVLIYEFYSRNFTRQKMLRPLQGNYTDTLNRQLARPCER